MSRKNTVNKENTIGYRLKLLRKELGLKQKEMAEKLGLSQGFYANLEVDRYSPRKDVLLRLAKQYGVNLHWLLTGEGPKYVFKSERKEEKVISPDEVLEKDVTVVPLTLEFLKSYAKESFQKGDYVIIPYYKESRVSAGPGAFPSDFPAEPLILPKEYLRRFFGLTSFQGLSLVPVSGRSMEMTIPDKSLAVVRDWRLDGGFFDGRVYVLVVDELLYVKRVYFDKENEKLYLVSDNQNVPRIEVKWDDKVHIIGRVVGCISFVEVG